ncbi:MAG: DUF192 domain-containing protein [Bacteroidetes bacterium]|nr:DUF192 domain-containing protein [Bacteroidota bacterium]
MGTSKLLSIRPILLSAFLSFGLGSGLGGCSPTDKPVPVAEEVHVNIPFRADGWLTIARGGKIYQDLTIEVAEDDSSRTRGLMQRDKLPDGSGMLFVFPSESQQGFWMANTRIALDLIFIREDGTVQSVAKYIQPMRTETVPSRGPAKYVLEVNAGVVDSMGLQEGDLVTWGRK